METILKVSNLKKNMGGRKIIDDVSFETYAGEVFGFLGPNGAGKTTTIKMIMGLLDIDEGHIEICGFDNVRHFEKAMECVGGIVENPETYSYLTGMQNLRQYKRMRKGVTEERLKEVVKLVGLENRIHEKVKRYSLGMRQRLGLAQAIMHRPKLIVMDEPTNGLDPSGIRELRDIFKRLAHEEGVSVLVSSHLLSEMELMCDRVGILANGRLIGVKPVKELIMEAQGNQRIVRFTVNDIESALGILEERKWEPFNVTENSFNIAIENDQQLGSIGIALAGADIWLLGIERQSHNLEDIFIEITGGGEQIA